MNASAGGATPAIADYGIIGDGRTAALISRDGSLDWCCLPHFDSDACFCRILDDEKGGYWRLCPAEAFRARRRYVPDTAVLEQTYETDGGAMRVTEFMPIGDGPVRVVRLVEGLAGTTRLEHACRPTLRFAAGRTRLVVLAGNQIAFGDDGARFVIGASFDLRIDGDVIVGSTTLRAGERAVTWLSTDQSSVVALDCPSLAATLRHWRAWGDELHYEGPYSAQVRRSALTLKLLTFEATGAVVAAPTTSLPERLGGDLNWDYRYAWLRDATLTLQVLQQLGRHEESQQFFRWLRRLGRAKALQPVYTIHGESNLPERTLDYLRGYRESRPVRTGNAAAGQSQLDTAGHLLDAAHQCFTMMPRPMDPELWQFLAAAADRVAERWREKDASIWETRLERRHFLHSKVLAWVALDRATKLADELSLAGPTARWQGEREKLRALILNEGYNRKIGAFTGVIGTEELDASTLMIPAVGFLPATDPRMSSTTDRVREALGSNGLIRRNRRLAGGEDEGAFLICSFWLADNLAESGRPEEAHAVLQRVMACANGLGLLAEEAAPNSGELLGNFPQGLSHLGLINSALRLARPASTAVVAP